MIDTINFVQRGVLHKETGTYVVSDTHYGYGYRDRASVEEKSNKQVTKQLTDVLYDNEDDIDTLVFAGDVIEHFSGAPTKTRQSLANLNSTLAGLQMSLVLIPGNHDKEDLKNFFPEATVNSEYKFGAILAAHGDTNTETEAELYITGHLHPGVNIQGTNWPCYLFGENEYRNEDVLVLPPFNPNVNLLPVTEGRVSSKYINRIEAFRPFVWDDETRTVREFPPLQQSSKYFG